MRLAPLSLILVTACAPAPRDPRPNLLLISLDSVRADALGVYGARLLHAPDESPTPNLDALAAQGVLYSEARATTSWTLPSHVSLFTGLPEIAHAVEQDGESLPQELPTLGEELARGGYRTAGVYSGPYLDARFGFARGFERYERGYGAELEAASNELEAAQRRLALLDATREPERVRVARERMSQAEQTLEAASHRDVSAARVTDLALAELERAADDTRPFFLFVHHFDAHYDYRPPPEFLRRVDPASSADASLGCNPSVTDPDAVASCHLRYQGEVAWLDAEIGRLLEGLASLGLDSNTLIAVVSDHGEEFLEHGALGHRRTLFEEVLRVPIILRPPGPLTLGLVRHDPIALHEFGAELLAELGRGPAAPRVAPPIARLVRPAYAELELDGATLRTKRLEIQETFWHEGLAVRRTRTRLAAIDPLTPTLRAVFEAQAQAEFEREELLWASMKGAPGSERWLADFSSPEAARALAAYRAAHALWTGLRRTPGQTEAAEELAAALRGLGYAGTEGTFALESDALVLPPPGGTR